MYNVFFQIETNLIQNMRIMFNRQTKRKTPTTFEKETVKENPLKAFSENSK